MLVNEVVASHGCRVQRVVPTADGVRIFLETGIEGTEDKANLQARLKGMRAALEEFFSPAPAPSSQANRTTSSEPKSAAADLVYDPKKQPWYPKPRSDIREVADPEAEFQAGRVQAVLLTATQVELEAVLNRMRPIGGSTILKVNGRNLVYYVGFFGKVPCALTLCRMGSGGRDGSQQATTHAIYDWKPRAIGMVGIAFGINPMKHAIGDVLVADRVISYESQRVGTLRIIPRGPSAEPGSTLLGRFRALHGWKFQKPNGELAARHVGQVLSGEKLIDNKEFKEALATHYPEALGGEMEGAGMFASAEAYRVQWVLVKAICDWADGLKEKKHQALAAAAATDLAFRVFDEETVLNGVEAPLLQGTAKEALPANSELRADRRRMSLSPAVLHARDVRTLNRILGTLPFRWIQHHFFESAHLERMPLPVFVMYERFNYEVMSLDTQIFDSELLAVLNAFHQAWGASLSHGEDFIYPSTGGNYYRFRELAPGEKWAEHQARRKGYHRDVAEAENAFIKLLETIKQKYRELDLYKIGQLAAKSYDYKPARTRELEKPAKDRKAKAEPKVSRPGKKHVKRKR